METPTFVALALVILGYALVSGRLARSPITAPMVFTALGLALGPVGFGVIDAELDSGWFHTLAEVTLVLVLFTDAAAIDLRALRREHRVPVRLLAVGLPLTLVFGAAAAALVFPEMDLWLAALLAAILAPTDAALGQAVVTLEQVPLRLRQALNIESGLNDGLVLPAVLVLLALAGMAEHTASAGAWVRFAALQVTLGPAVGIAVAYGGGRLLERARRHGWITHSFEDLSALGLALLAYALAEQVGGNGFISAFFAGATLGNCCRQLCDCLYEFAEAEGQLLTLLIFLVFGAVMVPFAWERLEWRGVLYAVLSLTVLRMLPVALSLLGLGLRRGAIGFLGWFGPRGIASILFGLLLLEQSGLREAEGLLAVVMLTVLLSVVAHGLTAWPLAQRAGGMMEPTDGR